MRNRDPWIWAAGKNNLAGALQAQASRAGGAEGAALLGQAVAAWRDALQVRTRAEYPVDWAMTQNNLASAGLDWSRHDTCTDSRPHLRAALDHVEAALGVYDPVHMPYDHGTATALRNRILTALRNLGEAP